MRRAGLCGQSSAVLVTAGWMVRRVTGQQKHAIRHALQVHLNISVLHQENGPWFEFWSRAALCLPPVNMKIKEERNIVHPHQVVRSSPADLVKTRCSTVAVLEVLIGSCAVCCRGFQRAPLSLKLRLLRRKFLKWLGWLYGCVKISVSVLLLQRRLVTGARLPDAQPRVMKKLWEVVQELAIWFIVVGWHITCSVWSTGNF
jgi:hypothetical protein